MCFSHNYKKKPWPTKEAMEQVYELNLWGGDHGEFYSGDGSHHSAIVGPYIKVVSEFLKSFHKPLELVDLGCGDFNVGSQLCELVSKYTAVDIVECLIHHNKKTFKAHNLNFINLDISQQALPKGDCAILRQVLQHLSNREVQRVVDKLSIYKYVILTEHIPKGSFSPNVDLISGQGIRLKKNSGINLFEAPFNLKVKKAKELLSVDDLKWRGKIVTTLLEMH